MTLTCRNCKRDNHPSYDKKYGGYCLDCFNAKVPEKDDQIAELYTEILGLREKVDSLRRELDDA